MRTRTAQPGKRMGIAMKIALLSWSVTLLTLFIFVAAVIPEQKLIFLENLHSKGRGIAASLHVSAAGAVVTEDYSTVVDHCLELLKGDPELDYLVLVQMDGFALIIDQFGWRDDKQLKGPWLPVGRSERSGIETVPLFKKQAFNYSIPFDPSGIEWGWIHVGLSLNSYERSVASVYGRTAVLAIICVALSAAVSIGYSRRLVSPIDSLQEVVRLVAQGRLSARAKIRSGDEIESLAISFNGMTDALQHRDRILESVRFAAQELLSTDDWRTMVDAVLAKLGQAANVSSICIFENHTEPDGFLLFSQRYEWIASKGKCDLNREGLQNLHWNSSGLNRWRETFHRGETVSAHVRDLGETERAVVNPQAKSLIFTPIVVLGTWWGLVGFNQWDRERTWNDAERISLKAAADTLGAAIERTNTQDALLEAKQTLEQRVAERTRELQEQVVAREHAHSELASMQRQLMDLSRQSGMAELATGVLHNVGNALNSVNVSATLVTDRIRNSRLANLVRVADKLREHRDDLAEFVSQDPAGKMIPDYLINVSSQLQKEHTSVLEELNALASNVEHVKGIVAVQQTHTRIGGVIEMLPVTPIVEEALKIAEGGFERQGIRLVREFEQLPTLAVDRHKILQILHNLLRNAEQALAEGIQEIGVITIRTLRHGEDCIRIQVEDNGVGIEGESLKHLFAFGFTTKRDGHGFGLHSGAIAAKQMGGSLSAESKGSGMGATFTLELPVAGNTTEMPSP